MAGLPSFPKFDVHTDENSLGIRWRKYLGKLENLFIGLNIENRKRKKALLLHYSGDEVYDIYETLNLGADDSNYDDTKTVLTAYFEPKKNKEFERYEFRNLTNSKMKPLISLQPGFVKNQRTVNLLIRTEKSKVR